MQNGRENENGSVPIEQQSRPQPTPTPSQPKQLVVKTGPSDFSGPPQPSPQHPSAHFHSTPGAGRCARGRGPSVNRMPTFAEGEPSTQMAGTPRHALHMNNQSPRQYYDAFHGSTILSTPLGTGQNMAFGAPVMHVATASSDHSPEAYLSPRAVHTPFAHMTPPWQVANSPTYWPGRAFHGPPMMGPPVQAVPAASFFMPHPYPMATGLPPAMAIGPSMHFTAWPEVQIGNGYPGNPGPVPHWEDPSMRWDGLAPQADLANYPMAEDYQQSAHLPSSAAELHGGHPNGSHRSRDPQAQRRHRRQHEREVNGVPARSRPHTGAVGSSAQDGGSNPEDGDETSRAKKGPAQDFTAEEVLAYADRRKIVNKDGTITDFSGRPLKIESTDSQNKPKFRLTARQRRSHKRRMHEDWLKAEEAKLQTANGEGPSSDASQEPTASSSQEEIALEDGVGSEPQSVEPEAVPTK